MADAAALPQPEVIGEAVNDPVVTVKTDMGRFFVEPDATVMIGDQLFRIVVDTDERFELFQDIAARTQVLRYLGKDSLALTEGQFDIELSPPVPLTRHGQRIETVSFDPYSTSHRSLKPAVQEVMTNEAQIRKAREEIETISASDSRPEDDYRELEAAINRLRKVEEGLEPPHESSPIPEDMRSVVKVDIKSYVPLVGDVTEDAVHASAHRLSYWVNDSIQHGANQMVYWHRVQARLKGFTMKAMPLVFAAGANYSLIDGDPIWTGRGFVVGWILSTGGAILGNEMSSRPRMLSLVRRRSKENSGFRGWVRKRADKFAEKRRGQLPASVDRPGIGLREIVSLVPVEEEIPKTE